MSILTLDIGGLDLEVPVQSAGHAEPKEVGERRYTFNGNERSFIRQELMVVPVVIVNLQSEDVKTIRDLFAQGAQVLCNGEVFNNTLTDILCSGEITDEAETGGEDGEDPYWVVNLTLAEVANDESLRGL